MSRSTLYRLALNLCLLSGAIASPISIRQDSVRKELIVAQQALWKPEFPSSRYTLLPTPSPSPLTPRNDPGFKRFFNTSTTLSTPQAPALTTLTTLITKTAQTSSLEDPMTSTVWVTSTARHSVARAAKTVTTWITETPVTSTTSTVDSSTTSQAAPVFGVLASAPLRVNFQTAANLANVHVYITGLDSSGRTVMLTTSGSYYYPQTSSQVPVPIAADVALQPVATPDGTGIVAPSPMNPSDPSHGTNWGFVELTWTSAGGLFANISYVDFVGLPLGIKLATQSGGTQSALGVPQGGAAQVCAKLKAIGTTSGIPWGNSCIYAGGKLVRVLSPGSMAASGSVAFQNYFNNYVDSVWNYYTTQTLTFNPQNGLPNIACRVANGMLQCQGDNRAYPKPTANDIFGCATGPFSILSTDNNVHRAVVPRLCAAFNRATLHLEGGNIQPSLHSKKYYTTHPNNQYSKIVHQVEKGGKGYAFPYDDVSPSTSRSVAGAVFATDPTVFTVIIGGSS